MDDDTEVLEMARRLRSVFDNKTLLAITPPWADKEDPHVRLARTLHRLGLGLVTSRGAIA